MFTLFMRMQNIFASLRKFLIWFFKGGLFKEAELQGKRSERSRKRAEKWTKKDFKKEKRRQWGKYNTRVRMAFESNLMSDTF